MEPYNQYRELEEKTRIVKDRRRTEDRELEAMHHKDEAWLEKDNSAQLAQLKDYDEKAKGFLEKLGNIESNKSVALLGQQAVELRELQNQHALELRNLQRRHTSEQAARAKQSDDAVRDTKKRHEAERNVITANYTRKKKKHEVDFEKAKDALRIKRQAEDADLGAALVEVSILYFRSRLRLNARVGFFIRS